MLFVNIETVACAARMEDLSPAMQALWLRKASFISKAGETPGDVFARAGIYAEFGRVVCISIGMVSDGELRIKSFAQSDEKELLETFVKALSATVSKYKDLVLLAHHGKEFDFPFIARRFLVNGIKVPLFFAEIRSNRKKARFLELLDLWKFGDYKNFTPLELLAEILSVPIPEGYAESSENFGLYWHQGTPEVIQAMSEARLRLTAEVYKRLREGFPGSNLD